MTRAMSDCVPNLVTEADYQSLESQLERQYAESGMRDLTGEVPVVGSSSPALQRSLCGIGDLIFQFGKTFDMSNDNVLSQLSKFVVYLSYTRLPVNSYSGPILAALLAVRDHYALDGSQPGSIH